MRAFRFEGDTSGVLHVGPGQTVIVQHPEDLEFLVNVYVYENGILILPTDFICYNIEMHIWYVCLLYDCMRLLEIYTLVRRLTKLVKFHLLLFT